MESTKFGTARPDTPISYHYISTLFPRMLRCIPNTLRNTVHEATYEIIAVRITPYSLLIFNIHICFRRKWTCYVQSVSIPSNESMYSKDIGHGCQSLPASCICTVMSVESMLESSSSAVPPKQGRYTLREDFPGTALVASTFHHAQLAPDMYLDECLNCGSGPKFLLFLILCASKSRPGIFCPLLRFSSLALGFEQLRVCSLFPIYIAFHLDLSTQ
jgi:hypothetical protein